MLKEVCKAQVHDLITKLTVMKPFCEDCGSLRSNTMGRKLNVLISMNQYPAQSCIHLGFLSFKDQQRNGLAFRVYDAILKHYRKDIAIAS